VLPNPDMTAQARCWRQSRRIVWIFLSSSAIFLVAPTAAPGDHLFDLNEGAVIIDHSPVKAGDQPEELLAQGGEYGAVTFVDGQPKGTVHFIEWIMPELVTPGRIRLYAGADSCTSTLRTFDRFRLLADLGNGLEPIVDETIPVPYDYLAPCPQAGLLLAIGTPAVPASHFRAEFTQFRESGFSGPRVTELDGYAAPVLCGDVNLDGEITATDALWVLSYAVGIFYHCEECVCDVTADATLAASDALAVLAFTVGQAVTLDCPSCPLSEVAK